MNFSILSRAGRSMPVLSVCVLLLGVAAPAAPAVTLAPKIYVASTGSDTASGAQTAPKRTFASALTAVAAGGEIVALDTTNYGTATIKKSVTITAVPGAVGYVTAGANADGIDIEAGTNDIVILRGLIIEGNSYDIFSTNSSNDGVNLVTAGTLRMENCKVSKFVDGIASNTTISTNISVSDCEVSDGYEGIIFSASSDLTVVDATVSGCRVDDMAIDCVVAYTNDDGSSARVTVSHCVLSNAAIGLNSTGSSASVYMNDSVVTGITQAGVASNDSGMLFSAGNNKFSHNVADGSFNVTNGTK